MKKEENTFNVVFTEPVKPNSVEYKLNELNGELKEISFYDFLDNLEIGFERKVSGEERNEKIKNGVNHIDYPLF